MKTEDLDQYDKPEPGEPKGTRKRHRSKLALALSSRPKLEMTVDMASVLGCLLPDHDGTGITRVTYRINSKQDDNDAVVAAHAYIDNEAKRAGGGGEALRADPAITVDEMSIQALFRACRDPENSDEDLFISPRWMRKALGCTDTLSGLVNGYNECKARMLGLPWDITDVDIDAMRDMLVAAFDKADLPELLLAQHEREYLTTLLCCFARRWHYERQDAVEVLKAELESGVVEALRSCASVIEQTMVNEDESPVAYKAAILALEKRDAFMREAKDLIAAWEAPLFPKDEPDSKIVRLAEERDTAIRRAETAEELVRDADKCEG